MTKIIQISQDFQKSIRYIFYTKNRWTMEYEPVDSRRISLIEQSKLVALWKETNKFEYSEYTKNGAWVEVYQFTNSKHEFVHLEKLGEVIP